MCLHLAQAPERILDAPDITDDYYLNLLDWSSLNTVCALLSSICQLRSTHVFQPMSN